MRLTLFVSIQDVFNSTIVSDFTPKLISSGRLKPRLMPRSRRQVRNQMVDFGRQSDSSFDTQTSPFLYDVKSGSIHQKRAAGSKSELRGKSYAISTCQFVGTSTNTKLSQTHTGFCQVHRDDKTSNKERYDT